MSTLKTVLIIEDDFRFRRTIAAYLEDSGYHTVEAGDGRQGIDMLNAAQPDVVLTDLRMPVMDGFEIIEYLINNQPTVPVIVISGTGNERTLSIARERGAQDCFCKPIRDLHLLEVAIDRALSSKNPL